ncbi:MAG: amino acid racemase [Verrucomicrobia bacterium]|nr:amino acid racemase [Verrucomicrobiota bacterium]
MEPTIGILGGMGPEATVDFFAKIVALTPARRDQDHPRVVIDSNPKVPDRTAAILGHGDSPVPALIAGLEVLQRAGANFVAMPCVSAHVFLDELRQKSSLPILSMFEVLVEELTARHPGIRQVGVLATQGTIRAGGLVTRLQQAGIGCVLPSGSEQERVMACVYEIKGATGGRARSRSEVAIEVRELAGRLIGRGAQGVVLGCTEIPLVLKPGEVPVPVFDLTLLLARAAIRAAGRTPRD